MKKNLLHEGLLELIVLVINARNQAQKIENDVDLDCWGDELDEFSLKMNEHLSRFYEMLGCAAGFKLENESDVK